MLTQDLLAYAAEFRDKAAGVTEAAIGISDHVLNASYATAAQGSTKRGAGPSRHYFSNDEWLVTSETICSEEQLQPIDVVHCMSVTSIDLNQN
ncbi:MAG: hypothetical protein P8P56_13170 [Yoonia sp.]|nr:hypothetical protein [Yoonia sp.]